MPSAVIFCLDWWSFELMIMLSGYIGTNEQSASMITFSLCVFLLSPFHGIAYATTNIVGNGLGANHPKVAKLYYKASTYVCLILVMIEITLLLIFRESVAKLFTIHSEVQDIIIQLIPFACLFVLPDCFQLTALGTIRATGTQNKATWF